ncbi:TPA: hypothetical protein QCG03_003512 [Enterobacter bugandensis]|uniref:hypothetical protein n=1 Tax=Enterobacter bugandensis TaxID=881260 RepID=UPI001041ED0F|nr:hypothetical protein [Enterobacter bugandensis]HAS1474274.1 hypothetical protein [Enterobacter bugandensis]HDR2050525.1 hypothetical protein [Enterobacter bugandensis]
MLVATVQKEDESGYKGSNPIAGVIEIIVQECTLLSKNTLVIKMSKIFKVAKVAIAISVLCAGVGYTGNKWREEGYQSGASIQIENDSINKQGDLWHRDNKIIDGTYSVIDGSGTTFINIPVGTSNKDLIKHFRSKDEYKNHKFFPEKYTTIKWADLADGNPASKWTKDVGSDKGCVPFQYYVDNNNWSVRYDGLEKTRSDYIKACGWNDFVNMSYKVSEGIMFKFKASHYLCFAWFGLVALFACIPAAWILFFRGIGKAYRSARNEIKGDKQ